jgi:hypothetical protein
MSDRRAGGARKKAGGLIVLSVAPLWVGVLGVVNPTCPGKSSSSDKTPTPSPYEVSIEVSYVDSGTVNCGIGAQAPNVLNDLITTFSETLNTMKVSAWALVDAPTVWDYYHLGEMYDAWKTHSTYRYWLVSVKHCTNVQGDIGGTLAFTPMGGNPRGYDSREKAMSVVLFDRVATYVAEKDSNQRIWSQVVVHEMGHQRASLGEYDTIYHLPETDPSGYRCIMHQFTQIVHDSAHFEAVLEALCFCGNDKWDYINSEETCRRYLYQRSEEGP